jgi:hypothetical protein
LTLAALGGTARANLVTNPGFETGDLTGWTSNSWDVTQFDAHGGLWSAFTVCIGPGCTDPTSIFSSSLYQDIPTAPGGIYTLSFWFNMGDFATLGSELLVLWNGTQVADYVNYDTSFAFQLATIPNLTATGASTRLEFFGRQDPSVLLIDDVAVEGGAQSVIPEPAPKILCLGGLSLFLWAGWQRRFPGRIEGRVRRPSRNP